MLDATHRNIIHFNSHLVIFYLENIALARISNIIFVSILLNCGFYPAYMRYLQRVRMIAGALWDEIEIFE